MNKVVAGRLSGHKIKMAGGTPEIMVNAIEGIPIDRLIVQRLQILSTEANRKVLSGFIRGLIGKWFGSTMWLSAIGSARSNYQYLCKLIYRDNFCSTVLVDSKLFNAISTRVDIER